MPEKDQSIGLGMREAKQKLIALNARIDQVTKELHDISSNSKALFPTSTPKYRKLAEELTILEQQTNEVREWYTIGISERLYEESKRLNTLTKALIGLTTFLAILTVVDVLSRVILHV